jgi:hypothetical protein
VAAPRRSTTSRRSRPCLLARLEGLQRVPDLAAARWFDFAQSRGGGVIALIMTVLDVDKRGALDGLVNEGFLEPSKPRTAAERRAYSLARQAEELLIADAEDWYDALTTELEVTKQALFIPGATTKERLRAGRAARELYFLESLDGAAILRLFTASRRDDAARTSALVMEGRRLGEEQRRREQKRIEELGRQEASCENA